METCALLTGGGLSTSMELFKLRGVIGLPDNFHIQQKDRLVWKSIFLILILKKQPSLLLYGEVIWQASDFSLSKELTQEFVTQ